MDNASEPNEMKPDETVKEENKEIVEGSQQEAIKEAEGEEEIEGSSKTDEVSETEEEIEKESGEQTSEGEAKNDKTKKQEKEAEVEAKPEKGGSEKKDSKKKKDDDFEYIVRIANTDIDGNKKVIHGLTMIKGVGMRVGNLIVDKAGVDRKMKIGDLSDVQIDKIRKSLEDLTDNAPVWMLNHRKDYETGENIHLIGSEIDMRLRDEINIMKKIRSYRGIRHERGLTVRGQRTRANNRKGLALGVSKKREPSKK